MTAVAVTSADLVLPPTDPQTPTAAVLRAPEDRPLEHGLADLHQLVEQHGHVVVAYPDSLPLAHERRLHTLRAMLETDRVALVRLPLPPLGVAVLARQLRQLTVCDFSPGVLASAAHLLPYYLYTGAHLNSVARLDRVPVTLKSHAKSWMPGATFAVVSGPEPQLTRVAAKDPGTELTGPAYATDLLVAAGQLPATWVHETLAPAWRVRRVVEAELPEASPGWWGTGRLVEFVAHIPDISVLYQLVASVRRDDCHWCGMQLIGDRCGFCTSPVPAAEAGVRAPQPHRT
ncbi:hypothetical protein [Streptomyces sp. NPDC060194]|uniref:hypothetical protein n=1 Tax=Streptomyces sp. NPDC060194 TaxID=3347069 RepID=UPI0036493B84